MKMDNITFAKSEHGEYYDVHATFEGGGAAAAIGVVTQMAGGWTFYPRASEYRIDVPELRSAWSWLHVRCLETLLEAGESR